MAVLNASVSSSPQLSAPVCKCLGFATWHCVGTQGSCRPLTSKYIDKQNLYWTVVHVNCSISAVPYPKYLPNSYLRFVLSLAFEFSNAKDVSTLTDSVLESHSHHHHWKTIGRTQNNQREVLRHSWHMQHTYMIKKQWACLAMPFPCWLLLTRCRSPCSNRQALLRHRSCSTCASHVASISKCMSIHGFPALTSRTCRKTLGPS